MTNLSDDSPRPPKEFLASIENEPPRCKEPARISTVVLDRKSIEYYDDSTEISGQISWTCGCGGPLTVNLDHRTAKLTVVECVVPHDGLEPIEDPVSVVGEDNYRELTIQAGQHELFRVGIDSPHDIAFRRFVERSAPSNALALVNAYVDEVNDELSACGYPGYVTARR